MPFVAIVTLLTAALIVGSIVAALVKVVIDLKHVNYTLATILVGVRAIALQTSPVPAALASVNANLKPVRDFCASV